MRRCAFIALFMLWGIGPAWAADPPPIPMPPQLAAFLSEQSEKNLVKGQALHDWNGAVVDCGAPTFQGANVVIGVPPTFDKAGKPVSGEWRVITRLAGCGKSKAFNLLYSFAPNGQMLRTGMLPGSSAADPILQRDALTYARAAMAKLTNPQVEGGCAAAANLVHPAPSEGLALGSAFSY